MKHVFISHAGKDTPIAEKLYNDLKDVGLTDEERRVADLEGWILGII